MLARCALLRVLACCAQACLAYVRDRAPLVIHFDAAKTLALLVADTHYRNQHETRTSGGTLDSNAR